MNLVVFAAIVVGILGGWGAGYVTSRRLVQRVATSAQRPAIAQTAGAIAGFLGLLQSAFLAFIIGGNFGAAIGAGFLADLRRLRRYRGWYWPSSNAMLRRMFVARRVGGFSGKCVR